MANQNQGAGGGNPPHGNPNQQRGGKPQQHLLPPIVSKPYRAGDTFKVNVSTWYKEQNRPIAGKAILLYKDGIEQTEQRTDREGHAMWTLSGLQPDQTYTFAVKVKGWGSPVSSPPVNVPEEKKEEKKEPVLPVVTIDQSFEPRETKKGWDFTAVATVLQDKKPVANASVEFYLDGISVGADTTDGQGRVVKILDLDPKRMFSLIEVVLLNTAVRDSLKVLVPRKETPEDLLNDFARNIQKDAANKIAAESRRKLEAAVEKFASRVLPSEPKKEPEPAKLLARHVQIADGYLVNCIVTDHDGKAFAGAKVRVMDPAEPQGFRDLETDANGVVVHASKGLVNPGETRTLQHFVLGHPNANSEITISVPKTEEKPVEKKEEKKPSDLQIVVLDAGNGKFLFNLQVVGENNAPVPGAVVHVRNLKAPVPLVDLKMDDLGRCDYDVQIPAGEHELTVNFTVDGTPISKKRTVYHGEIR